MNDPKEPKDKIIADSGWGIKPDDQPANAAESGNSDASLFHYDPSQEDVIRAILKQQRTGYNRANAVVVEPGRTIIVDINGDRMTVEGLSYGDPNLLELLKCLGASFDPVQAGKLTKDEKQTREYEVSRAWAWGAERTG